MAKATTPHDLVITPRDRRFGRGTRMGRWWLNNDPIATAFYNALSVTFPKGEGYFVDSVRKFREGTPPKLTGEINAFIKQEVLHKILVIYFPQIQLVLEDVLHQLVVCLVIDSLLKM